MTVVYIFICVYIYICMYIYLFICVPKTRSYSMLYLKDMPLSTNIKILLCHLIKHTMCPFLLGITVTFTLFESPFAFLETYFHKIKDRSHDLNNTRLRTSQQLSCIMCTWELNISVFEISFNFIFLTILGQNYV
jgi:hypothetical protein